MAAGRKSSESDQSRRGRPRSARSHKAVLAATVTMLDEVGYSALTMEAIAAAAGVGKATIYRWWPSKASLVIEALENMVPAPRTAFTGDTRADVRAIVQAAAEDYVHTPLGPNLAVITAEATADPDAADRLAALIGARRAAHASALLAAAARGDLPHDVDVQMLLDIITGTLVHRALLGLAPDDHTIDQLADLIVAGTPPRSAPRKQP